MRIDTPALKICYLVFSNNVGITRDTRSVSIVDAEKQEIIDVIKKVFKDNLERGNEPLKNFVKLTVKICENGNKKTKDEFSYRLYRTNVNAIDRIIQYIDNNG